MSTVKASPEALDLLGSVSPAAAERLRSGLLVDLDGELLELLVRAAREAGPLEPEAPADGK